jgi:thioesterase domain-containing protein
MSSEVGQMKLANSIGDLKRSSDTSFLNVLATSPKLQARDERESAEDSGAARRNPVEYTHLRPLRTSGARPPLICIFPGAPGARDMAELLPEDQPVYEIYWPNVDDASVFPTVEQLAAIFVEDLRKIQPHGPYQLCGYSTFGLVAYEMGRLLLSQGENVPFLALFDIWHPRFRQELTPRELVQYRIMRIVDRVGKYGRVLVQGRFDDFVVNAREFLVGRAKSIGWRATRSIFRKANRPVPKAVQIIESIDSHQAYIPKPYPKRFVLIRAKDTFESKLIDQTVGWHVCATEGVDIHFVRGDHGTLKDKPYVHSLVEKIARYLADAPRP